MNTFKSYAILVVILFVNFSSYSLSAKEAKVTEKLVSIDTYPFDDPNPLSTLGSTPEIYPYFKFDGYSHTSKKRDYKVVTLENDFIKVMILPEVGGKIWAAIDKTTGDDFLYKNDVLKFRNIAMRGPWASGGIEFNFGYIGHAPTTAAPVDYTIQEHPDGSVSCTVGTMDLVSRTQWRVKIVLHKDKTYFETHSSWFNPTTDNQSYYYWTNAAIKAEKNLDLIFPGTKYLDHNGKANQWPVDELGRDISKYDQNKFGGLYGGDKSYHVVGSYDDYYGGYNQDKNLGFGHRAKYSDLPGQKIWLWSQAKSGAIWEEFLTDKNGQYVEVQSGRLFNQFLRDEHNNPINKVSFEPHAYDSWDEMWFPIKDIGGLNTVFTNAAVNSTVKDNQLTVSINALGAISEDLVIIDSGKEIYRNKVSIPPSETAVFKVKISGGDIQLQLGNETVDYSKKDNNKVIKRPFHSGEDIKADNVLLAQSALANRKYEQALNYVTELKNENNCTLECKAILAELHLRKYQHSKALQYVNAILMTNTYHSKANYLAGLIYKETGDLLNAKESLGWAARDLKYRTTANTLIAEILVSENKLNEALHYANKALDFNQKNLNALSIKAFIYRAKNKSSLAMNVLDNILSIDPLNHFAAYEKLLINNNNKVSLLSNISNEFPNETLLELALQYVRLGRKNEAVEILALSNDSVTNLIWSAFLQKDLTPNESQGLLQEALAMNIEYVFPYRRETIDALSWAKDSKLSWKFNYYLGLNKFAVSDFDSAKELFSSLKQAPNAALFYLTRADLFKSSAGRERDLEKAYALDKSNWRITERLLSYYLESGQNEKAFAFIKDTVNGKAQNQAISLLCVKTLLLVNENSKALQILSTINALPAEHANETRELYEHAHLNIALKYINDNDYKAAIKSIEKSLEWPKNLGVGKPYDYDERKQLALLSYIYKKLNKTGKSKEYLKRLTNDHNFHDEYVTDSDLLSIIALQQGGLNDNALKWLESKSAEQLYWINKQLKREPSNDTKTSDYYVTLKRELIAEIRKYI